MQRNPFTEVVFYCDNPDAPEVAAASVLGITRIVPAQHMVGLAGARRRSARAGRVPAARCRGVRGGGAAAADAGGRHRGPARLPLPTAEMQFRESYIRFLLGESGSRQEAAKRAGVPYRTMCEMIRKLGIGAE